MATRVEPLTFEEALAGLQAAGERLLGETPTPRVLDAGCGGQMYFRLPADAHIVGIDVSPEQLACNTTVHERILGDIQTFPLPPQSFDLVICWDVLEHLRHPRAALQNLHRALRPGSLLILGGPNALSLKGLATWMTPFWFHDRWYRKSGAVSTPPFETYRRFSALPSAIRRWAARHSLRTEFYTRYESPLQLRLRQRMAIDGGVWSAIDASARIATFGLVELSATDFMLVLRTAGGPGGDRDRGGGRG